MSTSASVPRLMTLGKYQEIKTKLLARRELLAKDLQKSTHEMIEDEPYFTDPVDQASAETDKTIALQMQNREREVLIQIDEALRRIEAGSFGTCENCEEFIAPERLAANPSTTLCIDCKAELESEGNHFRRRA